MKQTSSVECLRCGRRGRWTTDAYASSRAMIEQGKVCPPCAKVMRREQMLRRQPKVWKQRWSA